MQTSPITTSQWKKVLKALYYSAGSGFAGGFVLGLAGVLQAGTANFHVVTALETAAIVGGVVGALNSLAVTVKQLFTPAE
jgi:hypothetical protein